MESSGWRALTQTLDAYVARDGIVPLITRETGQDGRFQLTGLSVGLYLVTGGQYVDGNTVYTPEPMLVSIPGQAVDGEWDYSVEVSCKFDKEDTADSSVSRKVQKVWKDDGNKEKRPENITVQLLKNGNVVDTVVLSQENNLGVYMERFGRQIQVANSRSQCAKWVYRHHDPREQYLCADQYLSVQAAV